MIKIAKEPRTGDWEGIAKGATDAEVYAEVRRVLRADGRTKDASVVIIPVDGVDSDTRRIFIPGEIFNPWGFDASATLSSSGFLALSADDTTLDPEPSDFDPSEVFYPQIRSTVVWDTDASASIPWPHVPNRSGSLSDRPRTSDISLERLWIRDGDHAFEADPFDPFTVPEAWAVIVDTHVAGITRDPSIVERVREGRVTNLDGLHFWTAKRVSMSDVVAPDDVADGIDQDASLTKLGTSGVDSGQMMIFDEALRDEYVLDEHVFGDTGISTFSYRGACSQTDAHGGLLLHEGTPIAAVSATGYGDGSYDVLSLDEDGTDGPVTSILVDFMGVTLPEEPDEDLEFESEEAEDSAWEAAETPTATVLAENLRSGPYEIVERGMIRLGERTLVADPCYVNSPNLTPEERDRNGLWTHVGTQPGAYRVRLAITDPDGEGTDSMDAGRVALLWAERIAD